MYYIYGVMGMKWMSLVWS